MASRKKRQHAGATHARDQLFRIRVANKCWKCCKGHHRSLAGQWQLRKWWCFHGSCPCKSRADADDAATEERRGLVCRLERRHFAVANESRAVRSSGSALVLHDSSYASKNKADPASRWWRLSVSDQLNQSPFGVLPRSYALFAVGSFRFRPQ